MLIKSGKLSATMSFITQCIRFQWICIIIFDTLSVRSSKFIGRCLYTDDFTCTDRKEFTERHIQRIPILHERSDLLTPRPIWYYTGADNSFNEIIVFIILQYFLNISLQNCVAWKC